MGTRITDRPLCWREFNREQHFAVCAVCALMSAEREGGGERKKRKKGGGQNRYGDLSVNRHLCSVDVAASKLKPKQQPKELNSESTQKVVHY